MYDHITGMKHEKNWGHRVSEKKILFALQMKEENDELDPLWIYSNWLLDTLAAHRLLIGYFITERY